VSGSDEAGEGRGSEGVAVGADRTPRTPTIDEALLERPPAFGFFQAVRLLQRAHPERGAVGRFGNPVEEVVRLGANPRLGFPASEIQELEPGEDEDDPWRMKVNFMGLVGHFGVLPTHYSVTVAERLRAGDPALADFLDVFHHRILSLFYRAWERYRFYAPYERGEEDRVTGHLRDLLGLGGARGRRTRRLDESVLLGYLALLGPRQRSALALERLIADHFGVPVEVEQFVGGWYAMPSAQCRVDHEAREPSNTLGYGALVGDEVWDPHARARIVLGPLRRESYERFLPDGDGFRELEEITRFFSDDRIDFELRLILHPDDVRPVVLGDDDTTPLAWGTWLCSAPERVQKAETTLMLTHTARDRRPSKGEARW